MKENTCLTHPYPVFLSTDKSMLYATHSTKRHLADFPCIEISQKSQQEFADHINIFFYPLINLITY